MINEGAEIQRATRERPFDSEAPADAAHPVRRRRAEVRQTFYLDLTDLMEYSKHNGTLSGIQRVVSSILTYAQEWADGQSAYAIVPVVPEYDRYRVLSVDFARVVEMVKLIEEHQGGRAKIDAAIDAVYETRAEVHPRKGDLFVIAGAFWIYAHYDLIMRLRADGIVFGLFVHDLIQIKNPQYVHKEATLVFRRSLIDALNIADFVLTNSHFVAAEMREFIDQRLDFDLPVIATPLATELRVKKAGAETKIAKDVVDILGSDFVLCVGTIEVRKNHLLLIKIWERLAEEIGDALPDLVFVGKWGWDIGPLREYLDKTNHLDGRLRVLTNASDQALVELYHHCLMTSYVSFAEGFGLPVGESLAYGKPCVASRATSLPEVGGEFARYIDPNDPEDGVRLFKSLLTDRQEVERWAADIRARYEPKTWRAFTFEFLEACSRLAKAKEALRFPNNCVLPLGATYYLGDDAVQRMDDERRSLSTFRMARDSHWHSIERWGCWSSDLKASLQFRTDAAAGSAILISLQMHAPPSSERAGVTVIVNEGAPKRFALYRSASWCVVAATAGSDGAVRIDFTCDGDFGRPDTRHLFLGLQAMEIVGDGVAGRRSLWRRAMRTRGVATARWAAARTPGRSLFSTQRRGETLRQIARQAIEERFPEGDRREERSPARVRLIGPNGDIQMPMVFALPAPSVLEAPPGAYMAAANCLARDFYAAEFAAFCVSVDRPVELHRRVWEYAFVAHHLDARSAVGSGKRGLAITEDEDPLLALFAARGCRIDRRSDLASGRYDFLWSIGTAQGDAVMGLVQDKLAPGGIAVFTGDLNLSRNSPTPDGSEGDPWTRAAFEILARQLATHGHRVAPLPFELGMSLIDAFVDLPPFSSGLHLKSLAGGSVVTSFGAIVARNRTN